jgi:hypothetical protein
MTITTMVDYFDLLQDKYGSPYFTTAEKERWLIQAEWDLIAQFLPKDGGEINVELNANTWMVFNPISYPLTANMNGSGAITKTTLESALAVALGFTSKIIRPLAITWTSGVVTKPVKFTRFNNWATFLRNVFKVPTEDFPRYYENASSYIISPIDTGATITVTVLRAPRPMSVSGGFTSELSEVFHNDIVSRALELAGVGSRDQMLSELKKLNNV